MKQKVLGVIGAYFGWTILWLAGGIGLALAFPDENKTFTEGGAYTKTLPLAASLLLSVICSLFAGFLAKRIAKSAARQAALITGVLLLLTGLGIQLSVWDRMPIWYHLGFLILLIPVTLFGARNSSAN